MLFPLETSSEIKLPTPFSAAESTTVVGALFGPICFMIRARVSSISSSLDLAGLTRLPTMELRTVLSLEIWRWREIHEGEVNADAEETAIKAMARIIGLIDFMMD